MSWQKQMIVACCCLSVFAYTAQAAVYPVDVQKSQTENGSYIIEKVYEITGQESPDEIPQAPFELDGITYKCVEVLREAHMPETEMRQQTETVSVASKSKEWEDIQTVLPASRSYRDDAGYSGTLKLDPASIKTTVAGYGKTARTVSMTQRYPGLSSADLQNVPKTMSNNGITYALSDVQWQPDNTQSIDGFPVADRYTAVATYTGKQTSSYIKGYTVQANYIGVVSKTAVPSVRYTAVFHGEEEPPEEETNEATDTKDEAEPDTEQQNLMPNNMPISSINWSRHLTALVLGALIAATIGLCVFVAKKSVALWKKHRKEKADVQPEENPNGDNPFDDDNEQFPGISTDL